MGVTLDDIKILRKILQAESPMEKALRYSMEINKRGFAKAFRELLEIARQELEYEIWVSDFWRNLRNERESEIASKACVITALALSRLKSNYP
jgi:hypothetical protein